VTTDNTETAATELPPYPECLLSISSLLSCEPNPALARVLHFYREAEVALQHAIDHLRDIQRPRWALACSSRAHELCIQANRYVQAERRLDGRRPPPAADPSAATTDPPPPAAEAAAADARPTRFTEKPPLGPAPRCSGCGLSIRRCTCHVDGSLHNAALPPLLCGHCGARLADCKCAESKS